MSTQQTQQSQMIQGFNYADPSGASNYLQALKLDENKPVLVSFLKNVPGMQSPPIVYCRVHWNSEMGENGMKYQCFGGLCCQQVTWQRGWGGAPGKFEVSKPQTRYYVPCIVYEPDKINPALMCAVVKYMDMTWTAYQNLCLSIEQTTGDLEFWDRDILITMKKVNGATTYVFDRRETRAQWLDNKVFNDQVNEQLPTVGERFKNSLPKLMTESEFLDIKPALDEKLSAAMSSHSVQQNVSSVSPQSQFGPLPQQPVQQNTQFSPVPGQPIYTQPQVNIPVQTQENIVTQPKVNIPAQPQVNIPTQPIMNDASQVVEQQSNIINQSRENSTVSQTINDTSQADLVENIPQISLDFDPSQLLK